MRNIGTLLVVVVVGYVAYSFLAGPSGPQSANLGQVLDRTTFALEKYDEYLKQEQVTEVSDKDMQVLAGFLTKVMNADPKFYDNTLGVAMTKDTTFVGFDDKNANAVQDTDEEKVFTVEIDHDNKRLIATDAAGNGSHFGFSGTGFVAGMLIGHMLSSQRGAGVKPGAFNNRKTVDRASYKAPASARTRSRSGGLGRGK